MVLQSPRHDFRGRCRAAVDQNHNRFALGQIAQRCVEPIPVFGVAAACADDFACVQERIGHFDRLCQQSARVVAQIDYEAVHIVDAARFFDLFVHPFFKVRVCLIVEGGDPQDDCIAFGAGAYGCQFDDVSDDGDVKWLRFTFAHDGDHNFGPDRPAHHIDRFVKVQTQHAVAVDVGDEITGFHAGLICRRAVDRRDDFHEAFFLGHFDAQPAKFTARLHTHGCRVFGRQVAGVWVKRGQHAVDRGLDQVGTVDFFNILRADPFKDIPEQVELFIDVADFFALLRQKRGCDIGCRHHRGQGAASGRHHKLFHPVLVLTRLEPLHRVHRIVVLSDFYIERF